MHASNALAMQVAELRNFCQQHASVGEKMVALLDRMSASLANDAASAEAGDENAEAAAEA